MTARTLFVAGVVVALCLADHAFAQQPLTASVVSAGDIHTCALTTDGRAYCWGLNRTGALGTGGAPGCMPSDGACTRPVAVSTDLRFTSISAGYEHTCALTVDSIAWCWGSNALGELGVVPDSAVRCGQHGIACVRLPTRVPTEIKFGRIMTGQYQTCALDAGRKAWCWGLLSLRVTHADSSHGICAFGIPALYAPCDYRPRLLDSTATFLALDLQQGDVCGLKVDGNALCWGATYGAGVRWLGAAKGDAEYVDISTGMDSRACALLNTGGVFCWGAWSLVPGVQTADISVADSGFVAVSVGTWHACGLQGDGRAYCWGANAEGQVGAGGGAVHFFGPEGRGGSAVLVAGGSLFRMLSARGRHTCGVTKGGSLMCWGMNNTGQLGDGSKKNRDQPTPVAAPTEAGN
jgi:hypothetical protein